MIAPVTEAGIGVWLQNVCSILKKNHEITLLTSNLPGIDIPCHNTIRLESWNFPNPLYCYMPKLKNLFKSGFFDNFDIIHLHGFSIYATDFILKHKNKISTPLILSFHGNLQNQKKNILRQIHDFYALRFKNNITHIIAVSIAEKNQLIKLGFSQSNISVVYNGVKPQKIIRTANEKIILYYGRLAPTKNIELLIKAFYYSKIYESKLIIAGKDYGSLYGLKKLTKTLNLEDRVSFLGEISEDEKTTLLSKASIFVHPSLNDVFSLTLIESASVGIPCIAFNIEGIDEIISNGETGILIQPFNISELSSSIDLILSNELFSNAISDHAKNLIPKKFSWNKTVLVLEEIYNKFLNN